MAKFASTSAAKIKLADNDDNTDPARAIPGATLLESRYLPARRMLEERLRKEGLLP